MKVKVTHLIILNISFFIIVFVCFYKIHSILGSMLYIDEIKVQNELNNKLNAVSEIKSFDSLQMNYKHALNLLILSSKESDQSQNVFYSLYNLFNSIALLIIMIFIINVCLIYKLFMNLKYQKQTTAPNSANAKFGPIE
jgi:hypothetical protein